MTARGSPPRLEVIRRISTGSDMHLGCHLLIAIHGLSISFLSLTKNRLLCARAAQEMEAKVDDLLGQLALLDNITATRTKQ